MDFQEARQAMVDCQLATNNVVAPRVLDAMGRVPREMFLPEDRKSFAYLDEDVLISDGRYLLEPMILGRMVQAVEPQPTDIALDIGCGTGYCAAILSSLVESVIAVESHETLRQHASKTWLGLGMCNIVELDGYKNDVIEENAPYDIIFINGAVHKLPEHIATNLKPETGRMVCVLRENPKACGKAVLVKKLKDNGLSVVTLFDANVPYLEEFAPQNTFSF